MVVVSSLGCWVVGEGVVVVSSLGCRVVGEGVVVVSSFGVVGRSVVVLQFKVSSPSPQSQE